VPSPKVRYEGMNGPSSVAVRGPSLTRMYGPAARCKKISSNWRLAVLHQCIRPLIGAVLLPTIMDISARALSLADRPRLGHSGHQCSHALGRPKLHLVSSSRRPRLEAVDRVTSSLAPHIAQCPCSSQWPFLRPAEGHEDQAGRTFASSALVSSKARPLASTAQAMRASLLASAIANTLWCNRLLAASIQDLSP
jgi:hypothetical protein